MNAILIVRIQYVLLEANYVAVVDNDPSKYKCQISAYAGPYCHPDGYQ